MNRELSVRASHLSTWSSPERYASALESFMMSLGSDHTRRSYMSSIELFWDWMHVMTGRRPAPHEVSRKDAVAFASWIASGRESSLEVFGEKIRRRSPVEFSIWVYIKEHPDCSHSEISRNCSADDLDCMLASMVRRKILHRTPTISDVRKSLPRAQLDERVDPEIFRYSVRDDERSAHPSVSGASILGALSSFWNWLAQTGENFGDGKALIAHNIWKVPLRAVSRLSAHHKRHSRMMSTPDLELFCRILATTWGRARGLRQARDAVAGKGATTRSYRSLVDLRDRTLLLLMIFSGLRADEVRKAKWSDLQDGMLTVTGKGNKVRTIRVPSHTEKVLDRYRRVLWKTFKGEDSPESRPLFPPLKLWGVNRTTRRADLGLSQRSIGAMMRSRAKMIGIGKEHPDYKRLHPHGLRHLAARFALDRGVELRIVQSVLGHTSLATTGIYVEEMNATKVTLE